MVRWGEMGILGGKIGGAMGMVGMRVAIVWVRRMSHWGSVFSTDYKISNHVYIYKDINLASLLLPIILPPNIHNPRSIFSCFLTFILFVYFHPAFLLSSFLTFILSSHFHPLPLHAVSLPLAEGLFFYLLCRNRFWIGWMDGWILTLGWVWSGSWKI